MILKGNVLTFDSLDIQVLEVFSVGWFEVTLRSTK